MDIKKQAIFHVKKDDYAIIHSIQVDYNGSPVFKNVEGLVGIYIQGKATRFYRIKCLFKVFVLLFKIPHYKTK